MVEDIWEKQLKAVYGSFDESILTMMPKMMNEPIDLMDDDKDGFCGETVTYFEKFLNTALPLSVFTLSDFESYQEYYEKGFSEYSKGLVKKLESENYYCNSLVKIEECDLHFSELFNVFYGNGYLIRKMLITYCGEIIYCKDLNNYDAIDYMLWTMVAFNAYYHKNVKYIIHNYWNEGDELSRKWKANINMKPAKYYHHRVVEVL